MRTIQQCHSDDHTWGLSISDTNIHCLLHENNGSLVLGGGALNDMAHDHLRKCFGAQKHQTKVLSWFVIIWSASCIFRVVIIDGWQFEQLQWGDKNWQVMWEWVNKTSIMRDRAQVFFCLNPLYTHSSSSAPVSLSLSDVAKTFIDDDTCSLKARFDTRSENGLTSVHTDAKQKINKCKKQTSSRWLQIVSL